MDKQTAERIAERFRELLLQEVASGRSLSTINEIEAASLSLRQKAGELVATELTAEATQEQEEAAGATEAGKVECRCGGIARFKGVRSHDLVLMSGPARLYRRYYYCRRCDAGFCPADQKLGLCGSAYSGQVQQQLARLCALVPYQIAAEMFQSLCGVWVSASHSQAIVARVDQVACAFLAEQKHRVFGETLGETIPVPALPVPDVLYLEADGVHTPIRGGWREMKVGICFEKDARGRRVNKRYVSHLGNAEAFGEWWYTMAAHQGAERARLLVVLGDGAHWLWNQAQCHFAHAIQVLDLWHALERLWEVAHAAFGAERSEALCEWVASQKQRLEESQTEAFLAALTNLQESHQESHPSCEVIADALTYYRNNFERMDYKRYRQLGLDVGSGAVESGCKQVVSQRLKGAGMRWCEAGASAIARLRCLLLSEQWPEIGLRWDTCSSAQATC